MQIRCTAVRWALAAVLLAVSVVRAELNEGDLNTTRVVTEGDWLRMKLSVLGLQLSYPAYRIELDLTEDAVVEFLFVASGGMAKHLMEEVGKVEAEEVISYHARGISDQVEELIREEFPILWSGFDARTDIRGRFLGPGKEWDDPPKGMGTWLENRFSWEP
jgi:hypothetical protein